MDGAGFDSAALQPTRDSVRSMLGPRKNQDRVEVADRAVDEEVMPVSNAEGLRKRTASQPLPDSLVVQSQPSWATAETDGSMPRFHARAKRKT